MNILQEIFSDYYEEIKYTLHPRDTEMENIEKMINCGDPAFGGAMYGCPHCGKLKFVPFIIYTGNISWNPVLSEHSLLDKPIKERAAVFYCRPLVTYKDWVFSLILLLYPMILTTKEILKILIINLSPNLTYNILFYYLPCREHDCHHYKPDI